MPFALLVIVTLIYAYVAVDALFAGTWSIGLMYLGYSVANIGALMLLEFR